MSNATIGFLFLLALAGLIFLCGDCFGGKEILELAAVVDRRYEPERNWTTCSTDKTGTHCTSHHEAEEWNVLVSSESGSGWLNDRELYDERRLPCTAHYRSGRWSGHLYGPLSCEIVDPSMLPTEK